MKRFVLLFVCAVVCLGVLAAPALAGEKVQTYRPPADTPIVWDAWWWESSPSTGEFFDATTFFQAFDPNYPGLEDWFGAVPKGREVKLMAMWIGVGYGYMSRAPKYVLFTYDVTGLNGASVDPLLGRPSSRFKGSPWPGMGWLKSSCATWKLELPE